MKFGRRDSPFDEREFAAAEKQIIKTYEDTARQRSLRSFRYHWSYRLPEVAIAK